MAGLLTINSGSGLDIVYTIRDQDEVIEDLTGGSLTWEALISGTSTVVFSKSSPSGGIVLTDASNGVATVTLSASDTSSLSGTYTINGVYTDSGGTPYTFEKRGLRVK